MAKYELMLILNPSISEEERNNSLNNLKKSFEEASVKIEKEDIWGDKKMAYKINSSDKGFYVLFNLELDGKVIINLTKLMNLDLNIWRHMFVKIDV
ncbi:MAG: 30S ribosomal protein S6 [Candidatus Gracilibacteria bacterium]|nr:30S ribosomal protein S6 [Candidatus Gracilibacteria bacterium]